MGREKKSGGKHSVSGKKSTDSRKALPRRNSGEMPRIKVGNDEETEKRKFYEELYSESFGDSANVRANRSRGSKESDDDLKKVDHSMNDEFGDYVSNKGEYPIADKDNYDTNGNTLDNDSIDDLFSEKIIGMPQDDGKEKKKSKSKMSKPAKIILIILTILLVVVASIFGSYLFKSGGSVKEAFKSMVKDVVGDQDPIFVLVLGVSEDISAELTDTIMLVGYNPDNNQGFVLSIPRDTFIGNNENTAGGFDKINALYQKNPQKTVEAVENLTGIKIDHYITVKTSVLVKIVDTLGGVEFDVPINMDYDDTSQDLHIHLKAGPQKLNGDQAEQLVRFRHNNNGSTYSPAYGDNDEGRMRTQREFLKVVANQVIQSKNVDQIKQIASTIFDNLVTNITLNKIIGYVPYAIDIKIDDLKMDQLPGGFEKLNSLWFYKANKSETKKLIDENIEKLGLTDAEKKKYLKPVSQNTTTTTTTNTKKNTTSSNTSKNETTKATTNNTTEKNNTTKTNTDNKNTSKNENNTTNSNSTKNTSKTNTVSNETSNNTTTNSEKSNTNKNENSDSQSKTNENTSSTSKTEKTGDNKTESKTSSGGESGNTPTSSTSSSSGEE